MNRLHIAQLAHEVNRAYAASLGDIFIPAWGEASEAQRASILAGVDMHIENPDATPEQAHESWLAQKTAEGWAWGAVKDAEKKLHPCFLPYAELPPEQKAKDYLFRGVVHAALALPVAEATPQPAPVTPVVVDAPVALSAIAQQVVNGVPVVYTGREQPFTDRLYGSNLSFFPNQSRRVPGDLAASFLRHADVFKRGSDVPPAASAAPAAPVASAGQPATDAQAAAPQAETAATGAQDGASTNAPDDTAALLEQAAKDKAAQDTEVNRTQDVIDQVNGMDKDALQDFAQIHYQHKVPKNLSLDNMRTRVADLVKQFGKP
ncbi:hypothetical protein HNP48_002255 [Acidovorax soli]|uniref:Ryanodine receptor Ryr domain-containing protein n=1 Tax=Acidovorax soli TaxID=592050 RepID=A0A7X0U928_9BURK|nr:RyR domain-containing protein [Acidovorax soli]MBB6559588.1 hypothetical protein [Acidovorax soli]